MVLVELMKSIVLPDKEVVGIKFSCRDQTGTERQWVSQNCLDLCDTELVCVQHRVLWSSEQFSLSQFLGTEQQCQAPSAYVVLSVEFLYP